ncbi:MAG: FxsB family radical SAM/SPASM domain protein [Caulobacteraceae bacterium]|nr:FxsB family radical SAM/SPASM domain protein [Caulobacteraceae bacterium]
MTPTRISSFLVKVASRCNLDCDYCYIYHHADQSWRTMPQVLSDEHREAFAARLAEYARAIDLKRAAVIFHGGEPLLAGAASLCEFARLIRETAGAGIDVDIGLQTNGLLLDDAALDLLEAAGIGVSLSLDGPRTVNDLHRTTRRRRSSFEKVEAALERLKLRPSVFAGVIAVVDGRTDPAEILGYFADHAPPRIDFLLPDAHHGRPPQGRGEDPDLYVRWLKRAFDIWLDQYPSLSVRSFEALLDAIMGLPSGTDAFGFGDVSLISIETDGTYHDLDVLKVVGNDTQLGGSVLNTSIAESARSPQLEAHRRLLSKSGLSATCQACAVSEICGGGAVPHRWSEAGFNNPTVYCREMMALIAHARLRLSEALDAEVGEPELDMDIDAFELAETGEAVMASLREGAGRAHRASLEAALRYVATRGGQTGETALRILALSTERLDNISWQPGVVAWSNVTLATRDGRTVCDVAGAPLALDADYVEEIERLCQSPIETPVVGADDRWLRRPFGDAILFEPSEIAAAARPLVDEALHILAEWRPALGREIEVTSPAVQFIRDPTAHPDKIVSFSDDAVPGALFVSVRQGNGMVDAYDLADSLLHEHRHQKLYLFERRFPTTLPGDLVVSPWREDLRPVSGLLHAIFVFVELRRFWEHVLASGPARMVARARNQLADTDRNLAQAFATLEQCQLTGAGAALAAVLRSRGAVSLAA